MLEARILEGLDPGLDGNLTGGLSAVYPDLSSLTTAIAAVSMSYVRPL